MILFIIIGIVIFIIIRSCFKCCCKQKKKTNEETQKQKKKWFISRIVTNISEFISEFVDYCLELEIPLDKRILHVYITQDEYEKGWSRIVELVMNDQKRKKYLMNVKPNVKLNQRIMIDKMNDLYVYLEENEMKKDD